MSNQTNHPRLIIFLLLITVLVGVFIYTYLNNRPESNHQNVDQTKVAINGHPFNIDIADSQSERIRGLSGRNSLSTNEGMLFIFPRNTQPDFWMKDMNFAIDILWIDQNLEIVEIIESLSPDTYPKTYRPTTPIRYVLELPAGTTYNYKIKIGDQIKLEQP